MMSRNNEYKKFEALKKEFREAVVKEVVAEIAEKQAKNAIEVLKDVEKR